MKNVFTLVALISFSLAVKAQSNLNPQNDYRQKKYLDSLQKNFSQPAIITVPKLRLVYDTPVLPLVNDGEKTGMSGEDTIYTMKTDNMLLLKPDTKSTYIPNAADGKIFMMPPVKKKP